MARFTKKAAAIDETITKIFGVDRQASIQGAKCIGRPIGCGGPATEFRDALSKKEYGISGLCQKCQDSIFGV